MKDMRAVRANEKIKRISTVAGAGGIAVIVTALVRSVDGAADLSTALWIFSGSIVIFVSVQINELLESEDVE